MRIQPGFSTDAPQAAQRHIVEPNISTPEGA
jgi:hypothetical protein